MAMKRKEVRKIVESLLSEMEEEDIGISLCTLFYQNEAELAFFSERDRERVLEILKILSEDSRKHKDMLQKIILELEKRL